VKDAALTTFGKYIDVTEEDIVRFGNRFTGTPRDYAVYIFLRSVPIIPSILLSFGSGVVHLPLRLFLIGTFFGTIVRDTFYIIVGYTGAEILYRYLEGTSGAESVVQYIAFGGIITFSIFLFIRKRLRRKT
jgi:uncharacterized membrane protein YdjX (TVP38/TMEM64 family)